MQKFYCCVPTAWALCLRCIRYTFVMLVFVLCGGAASAQTYALFEDFENVETGKLPEGWTWYSQGGNDPLAHWSTELTFFGSRFANSGYESNNGELDSDWLITPLVSVGSENYLIFQGGQASWFPYGDEYMILVSTTTATAPTAFKDTVARYTESTFPKSLSTVQVDLSAYAGKDIYIAFVHNTTYLSQHATDIPNAFLLDEIWVRPLQEANIHDVQAVGQLRTAIAVKDSPLGTVLQMNVLVSGDYGSLPIESLTFTTTGTTDASIIGKAVLYYTGPNNLLSVDAGDYISIYGTVDEPSGTFVFEGNETLRLGNNYFWLVYEIKPETQPEFVYPRVDATFEEVTADGVRYPSSISTRPGAIAIVPNVPANDSIKHAITITGTGRYGSSNVNATPDIGVDTYAFCAPGGQLDGANTIWWYFKAPGDGWITADLSASEFNSLLVFMDTHYEQVACHDDVNAGEDILTSRISNFQVAEGQELYIRVSGVGGDVLNAGRGEVVLDFTYDRPMATEPGNDAVRVSVPYPNPASDQALVDVRTARAGEVTLHVYDMMGRHVRAIATKLARAGEKQTVVVDVTQLPAGLYSIGVNDGSPAAKLMVVH